MSASARVAMEERIAELEAGHARMRRQLDGLLAVFEIAGSVPEGTPPQTAVRIAEAEVRKARRRHLTVVR